jgi:hypothetical protein
MFFFGIFGVQSGQKPVGTFNNIVCPGCRALSRLEIIKTYDYFHIFFIPVHRWNIRYFAKDPCCGRIFELDPAIGRQYEQGLTPDITEAHLSPVGHPASSAICSQCGSRLESNFSYCPFCGQKR